MTIPMVVLKEVHSSLAFSYRGSESPWPQNKKNIPPDLPTLTRHNYFTERKQQGNNYESIKNRIEQRPRRLPG